MVEFDVGVIILLRDEDEAFSFGISPFSFVLGKPLFLYAVEGYLSLNYVKSICLVSQNNEKVQSILEESGTTTSWSDKVTVVKGEVLKNRAVKTGLKELQSHLGEGMKVILVDGGECCNWSANVVRELVSSAEGVGSSSTYLPPTSLGKAYMFLEDSQSSEHNFTSVALQAFTSDLLCSALSKSGADVLDSAVNVVDLVFHHTGIKAKLIPAPRSVASHLTCNHHPSFTLASIRESLSDVCILSDSPSEAVSQLAGALAGRVSSVERVLTEAGPQPDSVPKLYNTVILFHDRDIVHDQHLLDFASLLDLDKQGVIIHVIEQATVEGLQTLNAYNLHRNGRKMAHKYEKLRKGVVIIHCMSLSDVSKLVDIIISIIQSDPFTFSGQTFFL